MSSILQPPDGDSAGKPGDANLSGAEFATVMLRALIDMAARSQRRQADLLAALRGADLPADPQQVRAALRLLQNQGCVSDLVPLSDGGLLVDGDTAGRAARGCAAAMAAARRSGSIAARHTERHGDGRWRDARGLTGIKRQPPPGNAATRQ